MMDPGPMKIDRIESFFVPPRWLFVRVESADGAVGWGEASLEGYAEAVDGAIEALRDRFIGHDPRRIEDIWQVAYRGGFYRGGPVLMSALAGLEQALWDLKGKMFGLPAWEMLGGQVRDRIRAYAWIGGDRPHEIEEAARSRREQGFTAVKMNATAELDWIGTPRLFDEVVKRVEAAQAAGMDVGLDFHGRVHRPMAKQLARALEPLGLLFIEEPLLSENPEGLAQIAALTSTPIALGERLYSRWDFKPFFERGAVDIIQPDLSHAGGLLECRKIAAMAEAYDIAVAPHCPLGPLALAACLQLAACTPNVAIQEMSLGIHYNVGHDLLYFVTDPEVLSPVDGYLPIPQKPGLGVTINEEAVREAHQQRHRWRNPVWRNKDGSFAEW
jgi:galactonate dehydratase